MDIVAQYVAQVLQILREKQAVAEQIAQLDKLNETLGLTAHDLAYLENEFQNALKRGEGYARYKQWDKAIADLNQAVLLKPLHTDAIYQLADAYRKRYKKTHQRQDREQALYFAERCLHTEAGNEQALALIGELENGAVRWRVWAMRNAAWGFVIVGAVLVAAMYWAMLPSEEKIVQQQKNVADKQDIRIEFDEALQKTGIIFDKEASYARLEQASLAYHVRGHLWHKTDEFLHLELELQLYDQAGKLVGRQDLPLLDEQAFELRPHDYLPLHALVQVRRRNTQVSKAVLVGKKIKHQQPETVYEPLEPIALKNDAHIAPLALEIAERYQTIKPSPDVFEHTLCLAYRHHGTKPLRAWRVEVQWQDRQDRLVHTETHTLIAPEEPLLKPDKWRTITFRTNVPLNQKDFGRYQVLVLGAE